MADRLSDLHELLGELVARVDSVLGDNIVGANLIGPFALGAADLHSDCATRRQGWSSG